MHRACWYGENDIRGCCGRVVCCAHGSPRQSQTLMWRTRSASHRESAVAVRLSKCQDPGLYITRCKSVADYTTKVWYQYRYRTVSNWRCLWIAECEYGRKLRERGKVTKKRVLRGAYKSQKHLAIIFRVKVKLCDPAEAYCMSFQDIQRRLMPTDQGCTTNIEADRVPLCFVRSSIEAVGMRRGSAWAVSRKSRNE